MPKLRKMNRIQDVLKEKGVSQAKIARRLDIANNTMSRYCQNKTQPSVEILFKIADLLEIEVSDLLGDGSMIEEKG